ncbi:MAG: hypothetical protein M5U28_05525 [Sandaracinaceae bacterium]|nr:hypothetical protein [Sandaracinaceae bacterium]
MGPRLERGGARARGAPRSQGDADPHPPIPADRARVAVLAVGDRVAITASLERAPGEGGGYREGASRLVARGVPTVTIA